MGSGIGTMWRKAHWYGKTTAVLAMLFILYVAVGFLVLPPVVKSVLESNLREQLHREAKVKQVSFNPFTLRLEVQGLEVRERDEDAVFFSMKSLVVDNSASSLFRLAPVLDEVTLDSPYVHIRFLGHGRYNFSDLLVAGGEDRKNQADQEAPSAGPFPFLLENFAILNATIRIDDDPMGKTHLVEKLVLRVPFTSSLSSHTEKDTLPTLRMLVNGSPVSLDGSARPFKSGMPAAFTFSLKPFQLAPYWDYLPMNTPLELEGGFLSADVAVKFEQGSGVLPTLELEGNLALRDATLNEPQEGKVLAFKSMEVNNATFRLPANTAEASSIVVSKPWIRVTRLGNGEMDWAGFFQPKTDSTQAMEQEEEPSTNATAMPALGFKAKEIAVRNGEIRFTDKAAPNTARINLSNLHLTVRNFALPLGEPFAIELDSGLESGDIHVEGKVALAPLDGAGTLRLKDIPIKIAQGYLPKDATLTLDRGALGLQGKWSVKESPKGADAAFSGDMSLDGMAMTDSRGHSTRAPLAALKRLQVKGIDFRLGSERLKVDSVEIVAPVANLALNKDGLNLVSALGGGAKQAEAESKAESGSRTEQKSSFAVSVGRVGLTKGRVRFRDTTLKPAFAMELSDLGATVTGFDSTAKKPAILKLKGVVDGHAPLGVEARFHSALNPLSLQAQLKLNGLDMVGLTPLTLKNIAYPLLKGKLSTDIQTAIQGDDLDMDTSIDILQLEVGDKVDNPEAADIPMGLALALLQDPAGNIRLDVPVAGKLSDPQFRLGKVIVSALVNVLIKIITSPFALLGGLFDGAEDADRLEFVPGRADVEESHAKSLDALAQAMKERPLLELEVAGFAPPEADKAALAEAAFLGKLQMQKYMELQESGKAPKSPKDIKISPEEYPEWLEEAYGAEEFDKPKNVLGLDADVSVEEMEQLMRDHIEITNHDLRALALTRAGEVRNHLLKLGEIAPERVFLVEEPKDTGQGGRVELRFK